MIYETLSSNTFLIELSPQEMADYEITYEILNKDEKTAKGFIKILLNRIDEGERLTKGESLTVEALPNPDGGCFFLLTFTPQRVKYKLKKDLTCIFETESSDDLLDFISTLKRSRVNVPACEVYRVEEKYFVLFPERNAGAFRLISEFGALSKINKDFLLEHSECVSTVYLQ